MVVFLVATPAPSDRDVDVTVVIGFKGRAWKPQPPNVDVCRGRVKN